MEQPFENPLFFIPLAAGFIFAIAGFILFKFPPKKINPLYGYRTKSSMKNQKHWDFAQKYASIELIKFGGLLALIAISGVFFNPDEKISVFLGLGLMLLTVILILLRTERAIKNKAFDSY